MRQICVFLALAALGAGAAVGSAFGAGSKVSVNPWIYDPGKTGIIVSAWVPHTGLPDGGGSDHGLVLQKNGLTTTNAAAGASVLGVKGITLSELGYDVKDGSHCSGGAPRFNVDASDGFHFVGACTNGTATGTSTDSRGATWTRYRFDPSNPANFFPPMAPGATVNSIDVVFDEQGQAVIDNIDVNGTLVGKPGNS